MLEKAPAFRDAGRTIDVRGAGREVRAKMGLEQAALICGAGEEGIGVVETENAIIARAATGGGVHVEMEPVRRWRAEHVIPVAAARDGARYDALDDPIVSGSFPAPAFTTTPWRVAASPFS